jgi:hypothetical protein
MKRRYIGWLVLVFFFFFFFTSANSEEKFSSRIHDQHVHKSDSGLM